MTTTPTTTAVPAQAALIWIALVVAASVAACVWWLIRQHHLLVPVTDPAALRAGYQSDLLPTGLVAAPLTELTCAHLHTAHRDTTEHLARPDRTRPGHTRRLAAHHKALTQEILQRADLGRCPCEERTTACRSLTRYATTDLAAPRR
ncbi:hypothetical protein ACWDUL_21190 [Nocardia niigatensis]